MDGHTSRACKCLTLVKATIGFPLNSGTLFAPRILISNNESPLPPPGVYSTRCNESVLGSNSDKIVFKRFRGREVGTKGMIGGETCEETKELSVRLPLPPLDRCKIR